MTPADELTRLRELLAAIRERVAEQTVDMTDEEIRSAYDGVQNEIARFDAGEVPVRLLTGPPNPTQFDAFEQELRAKATSGLRAAFGERDPICRSCYFPLFACKC